MVKHEIENRKKSVDYWLETDTNEWIEKLFKMLYPLAPTKNYKKMFETIILNLSKNRDGMNIRLSRECYKTKHGYPPFFQPSVITGIVSKLESKKYLIVRRGCKYPGYDGVASIITPTDKFLSLVPENVSYHLSKEALIRPKFDAKEFPEDVEEAREVLYAYNLKVEPDNLLYATYKTRFDWDGRFTGSTVINMSKEERKEISIDGEKTVELDIHNCQPFLLYADYARDLPGDAYEIDGIPRPLAKMALIIALNCDSKRQATLALREKIKSEWEDIISAEKLLALIESKHSDVKDFLYTNRGRQLMNLESRCMRRFIKKMLELGIKVYPVYDSVVAPLPKKDVVERYLREAFTIGKREPLIHVA